ncbi:glycosyltransferase family A protein [Hamadaea sp. NPDC051192]|uniref:glycosyltransferase n=1 Tax=Hamadaea sp. NPDC051192 TaxID=3154940 RepID=UPI003421263D
MAEKIRFSVVIPCFNEAGYVADALLSLQKQDFDGGFEVIVVDNNCTDDTAQIARDLGARVVTEPMPGVCNARQRGTLEARGEIVVSADADTVYGRDWLSRIDAQFRTGDDVVAVVGPCEYADGPRWGRVYGRTLFGAVNGVYKLTGRAMYASATNIAFRRDAWTGYDTNLTQGGDELDQLRRLRKQGRVLYAHANPTFTSGRRFTRGLAYNVFVSLPVHYLLTYGVNRIAGRRVLGSAPAFRHEHGSFQAALPAQPAAPAALRPAAPAAAMAPVVAATPVLAGRETR